MAIPDPEFDSRSYREILNEALARVPVHNPEWTNLNDSDPGVTLLQLFAFMTESIIYRANLIPERNRRKFLRLLGVPMRPAEPATGLVAFANPRGAAEPVTLGESLELAAGNVAFRTENGLQLLPIETRLYYKSELPAERQSEMESLYRKLYASYETAEQSLDFYEVKSFEATDAGVALPVIDLAATKDRATWLALLARKGDDPDEIRRKIAGEVLTLGIVPALDQEGCVLYPAGSDSAAELSLAFETPDTGGQGAAYRPLAATADADPLSRPGVVELVLPAEEGLSYWQDLDPLEAGVGPYPPSLADTDDEERLISWIRVRSRQLQTGGGDAGGQQKVALSWIGANAARVVQRARVAAEPLPAGTGEPDQAATLVNTPVLPETLELTVNGELWSPIDDLSAAPPEVPPSAPRLSSEEGAEPFDPQAAKVYALDPEAGEIRFGDGAHGMRPPAGATLQAAYDHGGGSAGVVGIGSINRGPLLPAGVVVANPVPTWGGSAAETVEEAERRVPAFLRHRDRLVSAEDFEEILAAVPGVEIGRDEILPLFHPELPQQTSEGVVTVMVIPASDPEHPTAPEPDALFLDTVCRYLSPRRLLTTELHVRGPDYQSIWVSAGIEVIPGRDQGPVRQAVETELERFLSPLVGGFEGTGWPLERAVDVAELTAAASRVSGVAKVTELRLANPSGAEVDEVELSGLQLPRLEAVAVESGEPLSLDELRGEAEEEPAAGPSVVPVPVVPEEC